MTGNFIHDKERVADLEEFGRTLVEGLLKRTWTAARGIVAQSSTDGHTTGAMHAVRGLVQMSDGTKQPVDYPPTADNPIHYPGGGGYTSTHPVKEGDEGTLIFHRTPIDSWHQNGGVQNSIFRRLFDLSDATWLPGGRSDPRKLASVSTVSHQTRDDAGNHLTDTHDQNGVTHQSTNMVLAMVGDAVSHVLTGAGVKVNAPKINLNC